MTSTNLLTAINVVIAILTLLGNGMVIVVMTVRRKQFSSYTNRLIRHQSIIDFVAGVAFLMLRVIIPHNDWVSKVEKNFLGVIYCRFVHSDFLIWGVNVASTYNLVIISLERFMATCYPVKHRNACSLFRIKVSMCAAWIIGLVYGLHFTILKHVRQGKCEFVEMETALQVLEVTVALLIEYIIPVVLMSFSYLRIIIILRRKLANMTNVHQQRHGVMGKAKRNVVETMIIAGMMFFVCWTPTELLYTVHIATNGQTSHDIYLVFTGLLTCNMCVNPVIYCFKYEHFRSELGKLIQRKFRLNRVRIGEEASAPSSFAIDPLHRNAREQSVT